MKEITKEDISHILEFANQFDKENYGARISGHFDSDAEYMRIKIDFIQDLINELKCVQDRFESIESDLGALEDSLEFCKKEVEQLKN